MTVWRLARRHYAPSAAHAYSGVGAAMRGGRWNSRGVPLAYASATEALALLEYLVHAPLTLLPTDLTFYAATIVDDDIDVTAPVPDDWNAFPHEDASVAFGDAFVREGKHLAVRVPSAVITFAWNLLINPAHPRFGSIEFSEPIPYAIDPRLRPSPTTRR